MKKERTPALCPVCGDAVPPGARACETCGACEQSGWKPDAVDVDNADAFDYDEFVAREFGGGQERRVVRPPMGWFWWAVAVLVLAGLALTWVRW